MVAVTHLCRQCLSCTTSYGVSHGDRPGAAGHSVFQSRWIFCRGCTSHGLYPQLAMRQSCSGLRVHLAFLGSCAQVNSHLYQVGTKHCCHLGTFRWTAARTPPMWQSTLRGSKTDPFGVGCTLFIGRTNSSICPVTALLAYLAIRPPSPGPLFVHDNGSPLTRSGLVSAVRAGLSGAGVDLSVTRATVLG